MAIIGYMLNSHQYEYEVIMSALFMVINIIVVARITRKSRDPLFLLALVGAGS